jgi:hypothetical protein
MNTQTVLLPATELSQATDLVEISLEMIEKIGGGDATSYPVGPRS